MTIAHPDIDPFILTGGQSSRFGRDKLLEPAGHGKRLVDLPIAALNTVFGHRVALAGHCDSSIHAHAARVIDDPYPGVGPIGGLIAALESTTNDIFVLAGDLPNITPGHIRQIIKVARLSPSMLAVLARTESVEPLIGLYRNACLPILKQRLEQGLPSLHDAIPANKRELVPLPFEAAENINTQDNWRSRFGQR
jgi:molybdopterin-guanine dinucleotide biosynthesis protein A